MDIFGPVLSGLVAWIWLTSIILPGQETGFANECVLSGIDLSGRNQNLVLDIDQSIVIGLESDKYIIDKLKGI